MILVTGTMRSGTSALSRMLHQSGVDMGYMFVAPDPGTINEVEYEDAEITLALFNAPPQPVAEPILREYIRERRKSKRALEFGFKTPFALPYVGLIRRICKQFGEPLVVIYTLRDVTESNASFERAAELMGKDEEWLTDRKEHNTALASSMLDTPPDICYDYEKIRNEPAMVLLDIQKRFNVLIDEVKGSHGIKPL